MVHSFFNFFSDNFEIILLITLITEILVLTIGYIVRSRHKKDQTDENSRLYRRILDESLSDYVERNHEVLHFTINDKLRGKEYEEYMRLFNRQYNFYYDDILRTVSKLNSSQKKMQEEFEQLSLLLSTTGVYNNASTNQQSIDAVVMLKQISEMANIDNLLELMKDQTENRLVVTNNVISEIAHTIRTPISGIHAALLLMENKDVVSDNISEYIQDIKKYLEQIEQNLQAYRNLMTETLDEQISGNQSFIEKLTARLRGSILSCDKRLYIDSSAIDPIDIDNDVSNLLLLALDCIVENATFFANDNSTIRIIGKADESCYTFFIENDGPQISDNIAQKVFNHGFSTHSSSGKGLFLVKRVIQDRLGGDVDFENINEPNVGIRFVIVLENSKIEKKERTQHVQNLNSGK